MTPDTAKPTTHEACFDAAAPEARARLEAIQATVEALIPSARRCVSYGMPAFRDGRVFFYFGAFKAHVGVYPPVTEDEGLIGDLAPYRGAKGNLTFPLADPLPLDLIGRVALALHAEYAGGKSRRPPA
jgi:uncharacterized protein YdhG (YjbR/CyaY superfamily)